MGGFEVKSTNPQYKDIKTKTNGDSTADNKPLNSVYDVKQPVESSSQYTTQTQNNTQTTQNSNQEFFGYSIDELRKYLKPYYNDQCDNYDALPNETILQLAKDELAKQMKSWQLIINDIENGLTIDQKQLLDKIFPPQSNGVEKAIIEAYFNAGAAIEYIKEIFNENDISNMESEELHVIYMKKCRSCWEYNQDSAKSEAIQKLLDSLENADFEKKKELIRNYVNYAGGLCSFREILTHITDPESRKALLNVIGELASKDQVQALDDILEDCKNDNEKIELVASIEVDTLNKVDISALEYIYKFYTDILTRSDIPSELGADLQEIEGAISEDGKLTDGSKSAFKNLTEGMEKFLAIIANRGDCGELQDQATILIDAYMGTYGEEATSDLLIGVYGIYEQNPSVFGDITPEQFTEIMNQMSHGNYGIVVDDLLRGDGVHTPLNMNTEGSAYDQQTGGFTTNPEVNYDAQSTLIAQLQQAMYNGTESNPLPKRVTENNNSTESKSSKSSVSYTKPSFIATYQQGVEYLENSANGVRDFLTGKVKGAYGAFETYVIEKYKTLGNEQGGILADSTENFFEKLKNKTKISAVENYFAAGGKGNSVNRTKAMHEMVEEYDKKNKKMGC